jgi:hypothetical protein
MSRGGLREQQTSGEQISKAFHRLAPLTDLEHLSNSKSVFATA